MALVFQVLPNRLFQVRRFREFFFQCFGEPFHLSLKWLTIVFQFGSSSGSPVFVEIIESKQKVKHPKNDNVGRFLRLCARTPARQSRRDFRE
jgi:hypothetical protein